MAQSVLIPRFEKCNHLSLIEFNILLQRPQCDDLQLWVCKHSKCALHDVLVGENIFFEYSREVLFVVNRCIVFVVDEMKNCIH